MKEELIRELCLIFEQHGKSLDNQLVRERMIRRVVDKYFPNKEIKIDREMVLEYFIPEEAKKRFAEGNLTHIVESILVTVQEWEKVIMPKILNK